MEKDRRFLKINGTWKSEKEIPDRKGLNIARYEVIQCGMHLLISAKITIFANLYTTVTFLKNHTVNTFI